MSVVVSVILALLVVPVYVGVLGVMGALIQYLQAMTIKVKER